MGAGDDRVWNEVCHLLEPRHGWSLEPSTSPGGPPSWCFASEGEVEFSITVSGGALSLYVSERDEDVSLPDLASLTSWLSLNEARFD